MTTPLYQPAKPGETSAALGRPPGIDWTPTPAGCPDCWRNWLTRSGLARPLLSPRAGAALASAVVVALTASGPAMVLAADRQHASSHAPKQTDPGDPTYEPGGPEADPPVAPEEPEAPDDPEPEAEPGPAATPAPPEEDRDDPVSGEPPADGAQPDPQTGDPAPDAGAQQGDAGAQQSPPNDQDQVAQPSPTPEASRPAPPVTTGANVPVRATGLGRINGHVVLRLRERDVITHRVSYTPPATVRVASVATPAPPLAGARSLVTEGDRAPRGARTHVVRPGESLVSIAEDALGKDASPTRVAREVSRLWQLNRARIGTGDADVLIVGTKLVLR